MEITLLPSEVLKESSHLQTMSETSNHVDVYNALDFLVHYRDKAQSRTETCILAYCYTVTGMGK
jgi:hypothetical protein